MTPTKKEQNEMRIETEIVRNAADHFYRLAKEKAFDCYCGDIGKEHPENCLTMVDFAEILQQTPEIEAPTVKENLTDQKDCKWCEDEGDHFLDGKCPTCHTAAKLDNALNELNRWKMRADFYKDKFTEYEIEIDKKIAELEDYNKRLLDENIKLSNELNLPKNPAERAKVLEIINADYDEQITAAELVQKLRELCWDHVCHSEGRLVNHDNPEDAWGEQKSANDALEFLESLLKQQE